MKGIFVHGALAGFCGWGKLLHYQPKFNVGLFSCTQHMLATRKSSFIGLKEDFLWGYV